MSLIVGAGNPLAILHFDSSSSSYSSEDSDYIDDDYDAFVDIRNPLKGFLLPRSCVTYAHDGDMLGSNDSTSRSHQILRSIGITSRLQHMIFNG